MVGGPDGAQLQIVRIGAERLGAPARHGDAIRIGVVHLVVDGELAVPQAVDHMHLPERAAAIQHGLVQLAHPGVQILALVLATLQAMEEQVLIQVHGFGLDPARQQAGPDELDDPVEGRLNLAVLTQFIEQLARELHAAALGPRQDVQAGHMLGAGGGLGHEEGKVQQGESAHGGQFLRQFQGRQHRASIIAPCPCAPTI